MRKSINGLMVLVQSSFSLDPFSEAVFVFCKENGFNPYDYLTKVFHMAPNLTDENSVDSLLPWNLG